MYLADFHIHSTYSDGKLTIPELVDFYGEAGFGAIAITDHLCESESWLGRAGQWLGHSLTPLTLPSYFATLREQAERAWDRYRMVLIPGMEYTRNSLSNHRSAHIVGLGLDLEAVGPWVNGDGIDIARGIRNRGGLAIAAHPVFTRKIEKQTLHLWDRREELAQHFDAWEVASGPHWFDEVAQSRLPLIASSDLHHPRQMKSWKTMLNVERHPEAVLRAIRSQNLEFRFFAPEAHGVRAAIGLGSAFQTEYLR